MEPLQFLSSNLQDTIDEVILLLEILQLWASEIEDESVVIEESLKEHFYWFMQSIASTVFTDVLNYWACKVTNFMTD